METCKVKKVNLFPKDARGITNWYNLGKATNIDKAKALHFIEALQNHSGTLTSEELSSAANIVNSSETSKRSGDKFSLRLQIAEQSMKVLAKDNAEATPCVNRYKIMTNQKEFMESKSATEPFQ